MMRSTLLLAAAGFGGSLLIAASATRWVRDAAIRFGFVDRTGESRKVHARPVPRFGGLGFVAAIYLSVALLMLVPAVRAASLARGSQLLGLGLACGCVLAVGLWDDAKGAGARQKLLVQVAAALILYAVGYRVQSVVHPWGTFDLGPLSLPVTVLWIAGVSNALNLVDGLDGLAAGVGVVAAGASFAVTLQSGDLAHALIAATTVGGLVGFLLYNTHPASIFMGDSGSLFLGTLLAALALHAPEHEAEPASFLPMVIALLLPMVDTFVAMLRRSARGMPLFRADRDHIHHRLLDLGCSHRQAVGLLWMTSGAAALAGLVFAFVPPARGPVLLLLATTTLLALHRVGMLRWTWPTLLSRRQLNRARLGALRDACVRIRHAPGISVVAEEVAALAPVFGAKKASLVLGPPRPPAPSGARRELFPVDGARASRGAIELRWGDGAPALDRDVEVAIEILCQRVGWKLKRLGAFAGGRAGRRVVSRWPPLPLQLPPGASVAERRGT